ncbi:MAG: hypothetical protein ACREGR_04470 [Minisyncoccia bacterium]
MSRHDERASEQVAHEAARWILREAGSRSLITVTRAEAHMRGDKIVVFVSVFPTEETRAALAFLAHGRHDFSEHLKEHTRVRPLPTVDFALDPELSGGPGGN